MNYHSLDQVRKITNEHHRELLYQAELVRLLRQGERRRWRWPSLSGIVRSLKCRFFEPACGPIDFTPSQA